MINLELIRNLIGEAKIREALERLLQVLENTDRKTRLLRDDVIILRSKYEELRRQENLGLTEPDDVQREKAQISNSLLSLLRAIESKSIPAEVRPQRKRKWAWLLLLVIPIAALIFFWDQIIPSQPEPVPSSKTTSILFVEDAFDFGKITQGNRVDHSFRFRNTGNLPFQLEKAVANNGFSVSQQPREAIAPNEVGEITVVFNSEGLTGGQKGQLLVSGNTEPTKTIIQLKATVSAVALVKPNAAFEVGNNKCTAPCTVRFTNQSTKAEAYKWNFGDGQSNRSTSPTHRYTREGRYTVELRATSSDGVHDYTRTTITILKKEPESTASWGWKRVTNANIEDAHNFLNKRGSYRQSISAAEITGSTERDNDLVIFYQGGRQVNWGWKRVTNKNLEDAHNFLNGAGNYSGKQKEVEIIPLQRGDQTDLIIFYQGGGNSGWGWKRVTSLNYRDALNFMNAKGSYSRPIKAVEIVPIVEGSRTDLIIFYQSGTSAIRSEWKQTTLSTPDRVKEMLAKTKEAEVITVKDKYVVFYKE
jgi:PKD repeat protein